MLGKGEAASQVQHKNVALFGNFGTGNFGNDGSLEAFIELLKRASFAATVTCICYGDQVVSDNFGVLALPIMSGPSAYFSLLNTFLLKVPNRIVNLWRAYRIAKRYDLIVVPGTGILDDFKERWYGTPYQLFIWSACARLAGTPFAFFGIGAGPIVNAKSRRLMVAAAKLASYRSYRDVPSKAFLSRHGVNTAHDAIMPDIAFALTPPDPHAARPRPTNKPTIGIGVMDYDGWKVKDENGPAIYAAYEEKITAFAAWAIKQGFAVRILIGDVHDRVIADKLANTLRSQFETPGDVLIDPAETLSDIMGQMAQTDIVVATRYHNIVCAILASKPVISIGYAEKNDVLLKSVGLAEFTQRIEDLDLERLKQQFLRLYEHRAEYEPTLVKARDNFRSCIEREFVVLVEAAGLAKCLEVHPH